MKIKGLSKDQVEERKAKGFVNKVQDKITKKNSEIIRDNVFTLFNAFNLLIAVLLALVGAYGNMAFILIVTANILIGIIQEIHAKKMVENISVLAVQKARVIREGIIEEISLNELVLDDITVLHTGNQICADSVVIDGEMEVNEAFLTGESEPVFKRAGDKLFSGSFVVSGNGYAQTEHIGTDNFIAKITADAKKHKKIHSELLMSMRKVTGFTSFFIIPIGILLFAEAFIIRHDSMYHSVVFSCAALLGMLPKGLVLLISTSLAAGIARMAKKKVLIQDLYALETLARVDVLCLDKTGTITEGKMCVANMCIVNETLMPVSPNHAISCFIGAVDNHNATHSALKEYFNADHSFQPTQIIPFSSERKWSAVTFDELGTLVIGAPEIILENRTFLLPSEAVEAEKNGQRILCFGYVKEKSADIDLPELELIAVIVLDDLIRCNTEETFTFFQREEVDIKIISGDNPVTVSNIAKKSGFRQYDSYIDMALLHSEEEIISAAGKYSIFGRTTPQQKKYLVKALHSKGHTVGMIGDGVNDVLALKEADCGIAIADGSDAARQVSDFVLLDSDFTALPDMVMEGRRVINNITRVGGIFLIKTIFSLLLSIFSILTMSSFPFLPVQITLYDFSVEAFPSVLLTFAPDNMRICGKFLQNVIHRALPYAVLILINTIFISIISPLMGIQESQMHTIIFCATGFIGLLAVYKACRPMKLSRIFIWASAFLLFFGLTFFSAQSLSIEPFTLSMILLFAALVSVYPLAIMMLSKFIDIIFTKLRSEKFEI